MPKKIRSGLANINTDIGKIIAAIIVAKPTYPDKIRIVTHVIKHINAPNG